jgi:uncharacterized protein (DUF1501 family)
MRRRDFLRLTGLASWALLAPAAIAAVRAKPAAENFDRTLVLLELHGGNDGLNTVMPYASDDYYRLRPRLALARDSVLALDERLGVHPALEPLLPAWREKELAVVLGTGYPNPNRSHFRSIEIWETASRSEQTLAEGWLARLFAAHPPPGDFAAHGIVLGRGEGPLAGPRAHNVVVREMRSFLKQAGRLEAHPAHTGNAALAHLLAVSDETRRAAQRLQQNLTPLAETGADFPSSRLGRQLQTAVQILAGGARTAVIKVAHGGFDTHANQRATHERLLRELAEALAAFRAALKHRGLWDKVLVMTYSEFGRRVAENGSQGTDHGTAAPQFLLGGKVKGGFYGEQPSLARLQDGDLMHTVDFRSLYLTVARRFWQLPGNFLSSRDFPLLPCLA